MLLVFHCYLWQNNILLYGYTIFYLSIHQLSCISIVSTLGLLWIMILWTFLYTFFLWTFASIWASQVVLVVKKNPPANAGDARDTGSIPGSGRSPGEGDGNPLQDTCLENSMDRGAWWATIHRSTILYSYQQHLRISISPQSCQHFPLSVFFIIAIPVDMKQYLIVLCTFFEAKYIVLRF